MGITCRLVLKGVPVLTAAGNSDTSACDVSPASSPFAITVGATDSGDQRLQLPEGVGSNYGPCIDVFAPGQGIPGASANDSSMGVLLSGTSQAVAFAAGAAALHMHAMPETTPAQLRQALVSAAAAGQVSENLPDDFVSAILGASNQNNAEPLGVESHNSRRALLDTYDAVVVQSGQVLAEISGAKRSLNYVPLLQVAGLGVEALVATSPAMFPLLPALNAGLAELYDLHITLASTATSDVDIFIAEAATLSSGPSDNANSNDGAVKEKVAWGTPRRFGGPFAAAIQQGDKSVTVQLPLNRSIAMASSTSGAFYLTVVLSSDDVTLDQKQIPIQVCSRCLQHENFWLHKKLSSWWACHIC
jgi:hypothetical protein